MNGNRAWPMGGHSTHHFRRWCDLLNPLVPDPGFPVSGALSRLPCNLPASHFQHNAGSWRSHHKPAVTRCIYSFKSNFHGYKEDFEPEKMPLCHGLRIKRSKKTPEGFGMGSYFPAFTQIRPWRVPPSKLPVLLPSNSAFVLLNQTAFFLKNSESHRVCFMGLFVCFNPKENNTVEFFPSERLQ